MPDSRELEIGHERVFLLLADVHDGITTRSREGRLDSLHVHLELPNLRADAHVWLADVEAPLTELFDELAEQWQAWDGAKEWRAYEGGLALAAVNDGLGHVTLAVELSELSGGGGWLVRGEVPLDAGGLGDLARDVRRFVDG